MKRAAKLLRSFWTEAGKNAARNLVWLAVWTVLTQVCAMLTVYFLTEGLDKKGFGVFCFAIAVQGYLYMLGCAGVKQIIVREATRHPEQLDDLTTSHFLLTGSCSLVVFLVTTATVLMSRTTASETYLLVALAMGNVANCLNLVPFFDAHHQQPKSAALLFFVESFALLAVGWLSTTNRLNLPAVGAIYATKWLIGTAMHYVLYQLLLRRLRWSLSVSQLYALARSAWLLLISSLLVLVPFTSGIFFVRGIHGAADAAILGLSQQVALAYMLLAGLGLRVIQPHISGPYGFQPSFLTKLILFSCGYLGLLLAAAVGGTYIVVVLLLAPQYHDAFWPGAIMLSGVVVMLFGRIGAMYLIALHCERMDLVSQAIATLVFLLASTALVPKLSYYGAAAAFALAALVGCSIVLACVRRKLSELPIHPPS